MRNSEPAERRNLGIGPIRGKRGRARAAMLPLVAVAAMLALPARAQMLDALRGGNWPAAKALASADGDPLSSRLVEFLQILNDTDGPDRPAAADVKRFNEAHPDWPEQKLLARRLAEAMADMSDLRALATLCAPHPPPAAEALASCAEAEALAGRPADAAADARAAWRGGLAAVTDGADTEADFSARWAGVLTPEDQWIRFGAIANENAITRQVARLDDPHRRAAEARLAFRHDDANALACLATVPSDLRSDPGLLLEEAKSLRRTQAYAAALSLWQGAGFAAEVGRPAEARVPFWTERQILARRFLAQGDAKSALALADDRTLAPEQAGDSQFLAGWILLRRLADPSRAADRFHALAAGSRSAITTSRAHYWLGRAAAGDAALARAEYTQALQWPTTFYGQRAADALGEDAAPAIAALKDPSWTQAQGLALAGQEMSRATLKLMQWNDPKRARTFALRLGQMADSPQDFSARTNFALHLGFADVAVAIARLAGRDGVMLPASGWPAPFAPPETTLDPALVLGVMRQESSFDPAIVSAAGARGLMQVMPSTAQSLRRNGSANTDLFDPAQNMRAGCAFLASLLQKFGGTTPYAVAAYNAGPRRIHDWLDPNGPDPAAPDAAQDPRMTVEMIDWVELIPFDETRNYTQRVLENAAIYRARNIFAATR